MCRGLPGGRISDGLTSRPVQQPAIREPVEQLLRRRRLAQREQPRQGVAEVRERVDQEMLTGAHDGVQHRCRLSAHFASDDAPRVASECDRTKRSFRQVVVQRQEALFEVSLQCIPVVRGVPDRTSQRRLRQRASLLLG